MTAREYLELGEKAYEEKEYEKALEAYEQALELDKNLAFAWYGKGLVYVKMQEYEEALLCFNRTTELNPNLAAAWNGKGYIHYKLREYRKALDSHTRAIKIDVKLATSWSGRGDIYTELGQYEEALLNYNRSIELDPKLTNSWNGRGNVYRIKKEYSKALECYDYAIKLDASYSFAWNNKGIICSLQKEHTKALANYQRGLYLEDGNTIVNMLLLASKYPNFPYLTHRLLQIFLYPKNATQWQQLTKLTIEQVTPYQTYTQYAELKNWHQQLKRWEWKRYKGILNYFMGDALMAFELLSQVLKSKPTDLQTYYYLVQSADDFYEPTEPIAERALPIIERLRPQTKKRGFFKKAKVYTDEQLQQIYYAGLILRYIGQPKEAYTYLQAIHKQYLPAAYQCLSIKYDIDKSMPKGLTKTTLKLEQKQLGYSFMKDIPKQVFDLKETAFGRHLMHYAHYTEVERGIRVFHHALRKHGFHDQKVTSPDTLKPLWYTYHLTPKQYRDIIEETRQHIKEQLGEAVLSGRAATLQDQFIYSSDVHAETVITQAESELLRDAYEKVKREPTAEARELRLSGIMKDWILSEAKLYHLMTMLFYLEEQMDKEQKLYLDIYAIIQEQSRKTTSDLLLANVKESVKTFVGAGLMTMVGTLNLPGVIASLVVANVVGETLGELVTKVLSKSHDLQFDSYADFKRAIHQFVGEEKQRLGERFEQVYPMYGLEELLDKKA
ncbi:MAG: tetratricopeptide repeat protein [Bacteroidota bacterium]